MMPIINNGDDAVISFYDTLSLLSPPMPEGPGADIF